MYSDLYGKYLYFMDMTHDCTKYKLRLCPPAIVCGLGMTTIIGCGLSPGEEVEKIDWILDNFHLNMPNAVVCTDRGPGWDNPILKRKQIQVFDCWHFGVDARKAKGGLGYFAGKFVSEMNHAMYHDFGTEIKLLQFIDGIISNLPDSSKAKKLAETMKDERKKLCRTCKGEYFTISKGGHSRGEGVMGTIKGNGKLKDQMKSWNMYELVTHFVN